VCNNLRTGESFTVHIFCLEFSKIFFFYFSFFASKLKINKTWKSWKTQKFTHKVVEKSTRRVKSTSRYNAMLTGDQKLSEFLRNNFSIPKIVLMLKLLLRTILYSPSQLKAISIFTVHSPYWILKDILRHICLFQKPSP
jgi:hypothetical protein